MENASQDDRQHGRQHNGQDAEFDVPPEHIIRSSKGKSWEGFDVAEIVHPLDDFALPTLPRHILVVNLSSPTTIYERRRGHQGHLGTGGLVILPAGAPSTWHLERHGEVRHLHLYLSPARIQHVALQADINPDSVHLIDTLGTHDPQLETIALSFLSELRSDTLGGNVYVESLTNMLIVHLLRHYSSLQLPDVPHTSGLPTTTLKRVTDYIEERLATQLSLTEIAAQAHLSPYHFTRLFKASTGLAPHQYLLRRRVERARLLLFTTDWSLTTIAHAVGFTNENHLSLHFKRLTGLTPTSYRHQR